MGKQEIHEYEASRSNSRQRRYCRVTSFTQNLQTNLRITLDTTRYEGGRKVTGECFYSPVTIETVYKGNQALKGTKLYVVEDEYTFVSTRYVNTGGKAFLPLQDGNSYIFLLKKVQFHPQRKLTEFERMQYYPITQTALGAFRPSTQKQTKVFRWDQHIESMHSLRGYDLPVEDPEQLDFYYAVKDMVFQKIHYMKS